MQSEIKELKLDKVQADQEGKFGDGLIKFVDDLTDASEIKTDNNVKFDNSAVLKVGALIVLGGLVAYLVKKS